MKFSNADEIYPVYPVLPNPPLLPSCPLLQGPQALSDAGGAGDVPLELHANANPATCAERSTFAGTT